MKKFVFALPLGVLLGLSGCYQSKLSDIQPQNVSVSCDTLVTYNSHIKSLLEKNCTSCHKTGGTGPFSLDGYANAKANATYSLSAMQHASGVSPMPKGGSKLSDCEINQFNAWIKRSYPN